MLSISSLGEENPKKVFELNTSTKARIMETYRKLEEKSNRDLRTSLKEKYFWHKTSQVLIEVSMVLKDTWLKDK